MNYERWFNNYKDNNCSFAFVGCVVVWIIFMLADAMFKQGIGQHHGGAFSLSLPLTTLSGVMKELRLSRSTG